MSINPKMSSDITEDPALLVVKTEKVEKTEESTKIKINGWKAKQFERTVDRILEQKVKRAENGEMPSVDYSGSAEANASDIKNELQHDVVGTIFDDSDVNLSVTFHPPDDSTLTCGSEAHFSGGFQHPEEDSACFKEGYGSKFHENLYFPYSMPHKRAHKIRTDLPLQEKVRLIHLSETKGKTQRSLASEFNISLGAVNNILKRRTEYKQALAQCQASTEAAGSLFHPPPSAVSSTSRVLGNLMKTWIDMAVEKGLAVSWPLVMEKYQHFTDQLIIPSSNYGYDVFLETVHSVFQNHMSSHSHNWTVNSTDNAEKISLWKSSLPYLIQGYKRENVFCCIESVLYYKALPQKSHKLGSAGQSFYNDLDERLSVLLCCNSLGERLKPVVVSKSVSSIGIHSNIDSQSSPCMIFQSEKGCVTSDIFSKWLSQLDQTLGQEGRQIALFLDMTPNHITDLVLKNISLKFYLESCGDISQIMKGIILRSFKALYRDHFLQVLFAGDQGRNNLVHLLQQISEMDAVYWINNAWRNTSTNCISKAFTQAGFSTSADQSASAEEPTLPLSLIQNMCHMSQVYKLPMMLSEEYVMFDSISPCCAFDDAQWEKRLLIDVCGEHLIKKENVMKKQDLQRRLAAKNSEKQEHISLADAVDCVQKLKRFGHSFPAILERVYDVESSLFGAISKDAAHSSLFFESNDDVK